MLSRPTNEALIVLEQISRLPRYTDFNKMIEAELATIMDKLMGATDIAVIHELRGRAKALKEFQAAVAQAPATLVKSGLRSPIT